MSSCLRCYVKFKFLSNNILHQHHYVELFTVVVKNIALMPWFLCHAAGKTILWTSGLYSLKWEFVFIRVCYCGSVLYLTF